MAAGLLQTGQGDTVTGLTHLRAFIVEIACVMPSHAKSAHASPSPADIADTVNGHLLGMAVRTPGEGA